MLPLAKIRADDGWCDEPADRNYNRPVRLPYSASAETMLRNDELYDVAIVLDWNIRRRARGLGSAVFLHIAPPGHPPTEGCVAIAPREYGAPAAPSVGQNGSQDLKIETGGDTAGARACSRSVRSAAASCVLSQAQAGGRRRDPAVGIDGKRLAHQVRAKQRIGDPVIDGKRLEPAHQVHIYGRTLRTVKLPSGRLHDPCCR